MILDQLNERYPNRTAFITGAGSGFGAAMMEVLLENEWSIIATDINFQGLTTRVNSQPHSDRVFPFELDVSEPAAYEKLVQNITQKRAIDLVINNAGIGDGELIHRYDKSDWERMIQINLMGVYYGCHYFAPHLIDKKHGHILNVGSAAGFLHMPGMSAYNASKAAVFALSETLYHELKPQGVQVSVVTPTFFPTEIMSGAKAAKPFLDMVSRQMKRSSVSAEDMANEVLNQCGKGTFHILYPKEARRAYQIKKWFPKKVEKKYKLIMQRFLSQL